MRTFLLQLPEFLAETLVLAFIYTNRHLLLSLVTLVQFSCLTSWIAFHQTEKYREIGWSLTTLFQVSDVSGNVSWFLNYIFILCYVEILPANNCNYIALLNYCSISKPTSFEWSVWKKISKRWVLNSTLGEQNYWIKHIWNAGEATMQRLKVNLQSFHLLFLSE